MSDHIVYEVRLLLYSFATGAGLMMTYDFLRILRIFIPHLPVIVGVEDMVYLKIVNAMPGKLILTSVNPDYAPIEAETCEQLADRGRIIGRAVWVGRDLD